MKHNDVKLINRILAGDENAFVSLVEKYQKQVHALAWRKIGDFHIAEEITQDTFLKVYQKLSTLKNPNQFAGWLYVIATNQCRAWLRKKRIETEPLEETDVEKIDEAYSRYVAEEQSKATIETQREVVKKLLAKLKESERTVMTLHYFGEMTVEEISRFLGVSASAIKLRLHRARQRLKKEEPMIREALSNFKLSPNLTDNIMQKVERIKPTVPSGSKPIIPWVLGASSIALIVLILGLGSRYLAYFQQPYSLDSQSELAVELIDAPIVLNLEAKPDVRNQLGANADDTGKGDGEGQEANQTQFDKGDYTTWALPKGAKARLGKGTVREVAYSPDGNRLAVASGTGIWLYDAHTGKELALLAGHTGRVLTVAFSPDGSTIASGSEDNTVMLWDSITGKHKQTLMGHENIVTSVVFSPNGSILASASYDSHVRLWNVRTGNLKKITSKVPSSIVGIVFNPRGSTIAGWTIAGNTVHLWNAKTGKLKKTFKVKSEFIGSIAFSTDGNTIVVAGEADASIQFWDVQTGQYHGSLNEHTSNVTDVAFSYDRQTLASVSFDGILRLWKWNFKQEFLQDIDRIPPTNALRMPQMEWTDVIFSPDDSTIATAGRDGTIRLWEAASLKQNVKVLGHTNRVLSIAFSPDGSIIASGKGDQVLLWNALTGQQMETFHAEVAGLNIRAVTFSPDGSVLATGHENNTILLWDMAIRQEKLAIIVPTLERNIRSEIGNVAFSPDGKTLASSGGHEDYSIYLWDVVTGQRKTTLTGHKEHIRTFAFSPDGNTLASCTSEEFIRLWDVEQDSKKIFLKVILILYILWRLVQMEKHSQVGQVWMINR